VNRRHKLPTYLRPWSPHGAAWLRKPTPRIKQCVATYHTTKVIAHKASYTFQNWLPWQGPSALLDPHLTHDSLGPSEPTTQTASRSVESFLHRWPQSVPILYNRAPLPLQIAHCHRGIWTPSNTWFLGPTRVPNINGISIGAAVFTGFTSNNNNNNTFIFIPP